MCLENKCNLSNPKQDVSNRVGRSSWYPYYAGYSPSFVEDAIELAKCTDRGHRILDPWNGSGTTTQVAQSRGIQASGFDLNPAMVVIAKAKSLDANVQPSIVSLLDEICSKATTSGDSGIDNDPLRLWLDEGSAAVFRSLDQAVFRLLIDSDSYAPLATLDSLERVSALAAFYYLALFRTLRDVLKPFHGSNPTWVKKPGPTALLNLESSAVVARFRDHALEMEAMLAKEAAEQVRTALGHNSKRVSPQIAVAHSGRLPVPDRSFDVVISSPPYCTRIDYAVKTSPELAVMGMDSEVFRHLRDQMLGTPTIGTTPDKVDSAWGVTCAATLDNIRDHESKASRSYYWKTYIQYFSGLFDSIREIERVLQESSICFLVVQDSYYKNIHVDLATICTEMAVNFSFALSKRTDFLSSRTMASVNSAARAYRTERTATESVLVLEKSNLRRSV